AFPSFVSFVKEQVSDTLDQHAIESAFTIHDETPSTPVILEHQLVRQVWLCIKECIHNAIRHSGAKRVDVSFHKSAGWIEIGIHDNGTGILTEGLASERGIAHIRQRMESLGGSMIIHGGAGTSIRLRAPLKKAGAYTTKG
ncbi:MAG: sensor histidine kinase, partial [Bacteroidota bacterium]